MATGIGHQLRACGRYALPKRILVGGRKYQFAQILKHDFFAATAVYEYASRSDNHDGLRAKRVVLKVGRRADFLGLPLGWLGEALTRHEISILRRLQGMRGVARLLGRYGKSGLVYEYIAGQSLDEQPSLPDDFFDRLETLLQQIHDRRIGYGDMNKRGNILLGEDKLPYMIDFQISLYVSERLAGSRRLAQLLLETIQREDFYHLRKHKRRLRRDLMDDAQVLESRRISGWIAVHRAGTRPLTRMRRRVLNYLFNAGQLVRDDISRHSSELDPTRWAKH